MKTIVIKENSKQAKAIIEMLKTFDFVEFIDGFKPAVKKPRYNAETEKAIQDARNGIGITTYKNSNDMFKKVLGNV